MTKKAVLALVWTLGASWAAAAEPVAGYLGGEPITLEEVDDRISGEMQAVRQQEYDLRFRGLEQIINERLLAAEAESRGVTVAALRKAEIEDKIGQPTDAAVERFYETNKARLGGRTLEELTPNIRAYLNSQQLQQRTNEFLGELREAADFRIVLDPPRVEVAVPAGAPSLGPEDAAVTVVEFSDFQCPYCKRAHPTVERILEDYGDRIRFVYRDYPLPNHSRALPASRAARCAGEQDRYWDYHDHLMTAPGDLSDDDLRRRAAGLELDMESFSSCLSSDRHGAAVRAGLADGAAVGVSGTPAFFINGRMISGAQPYERFRAVLDDELARARGDDPAAGEDGDTSSK